MEPNFDPISLVHVPNRAILDPFGPISAPQERLYGAIRVESAPRIHDAATKRPPEALGALRTGVRRRAGAPGAPARFRTV